MWGKGQTKRERLSCVFIHKFTLKTTANYLCFTKCVNCQMNTFIEIRRHRNNFTRYIYSLPRLTKSEKQERQQNKKKKARSRNSTITEVTILRKSVMYYLEISILLWRAGVFFSLKTMDRWRSVCSYLDSRRGPLKLWHHGCQVQCLQTLVKDLRKCWFPIPIFIISHKSFRTQKKKTRRGVVGTNSKLKFVSYCRHQLTQYDRRHIPVMAMVRMSKMEHCKEGEVICK